MSKMIVEGVEYELKDSLTLGETHEMSKAFGGIEPGDEIGTMIWMLYVAMRERNSDVTFDSVLALDWKDIEVIKDEPQEDDAVPPAQAAAQDEPQGAAI